MTRPGGSFRGREDRGRGSRDSRGSRDERGGTAPRAGRPAADPARQAAYEAVAAVHRDDAYANIALPRLLREAEIYGRDAALATELTYGTLRAVGTLDAIIAVAAGRDVMRIDPPARDALRLGAYQLLYTRIPPHAAVHSTVDLVRAVAPGAAGFGNAVLRQIAARSLAEWLHEVAPDYAADPVGHLAVVHHHPQWVVRAFRDALGGDLAETAAALAADNERPEVHLCARPGKTDAVELADEVGGTPGAFSPYAVYLPGGAPGELRAIAHGRAHVQDEGSQLVAAALIDAPLDGPDGRWLDLCAGPGGKAALLGCLASQRGARVTAIEVAEHRADMVRRASRGLPVDVIVGDGREIASLAPTGFDRVLVDAPCSGLGSLRRRPESRWRRTPADLPPLTQLQRELLVAAIDVTRPGGLIAYVTCSPHLVETKVTVAEARRRSPHTVQEVDARPLLPGVPALGDGPAIQLWPHRHGTDALYLSLLRRV